jgi:hypothetical protein
VTLDALADTRVTDARPDTRGIAISRMQKAVLEASVGPTARAGEGEGFRLGVEIDTVLRQFTGMQKVIILDASGARWSGTDLRCGTACLQ